VLSDFVHILPESILALTLAFVIAAEVTYHGEQVRLVTITAVTGLAGAFMQTLIAYQRGSVEIFGHSLVVDGFSFFFRLFFIALGIFAIAIGTFGHEIGKSRRSEYCALVLAGVLAMCLSASATDLILAFLCLQLINLIAAFVAGYRKGSILSTEAAVKYLLLSVVGGAMFLYGLAILFSWTQSLNLYEIHRVLLKTPMPAEAGLAVFVLTFLALAFQVGGFPAHFWAPDVLEGAPTPASPFLALGPRVAGFAVALRYLIFVFAQPALAQGQWQALGSVDWPAIVALMAGITSCVGSLLALRQTSAKRMMGCLLVAETGQLMIGLLILDETTISALLFNLVIELFAISGVFYVLSLFYEKLRSDRFEDLKGVLHRAVPETMALVIFLFSITGLPPGPSFFGKFALIDAAVRHGRILLATTTIISIGVSVAAVARLCFAMTGGQPARVGTPPLFAATRGAAGIGGMGALVRRRGMLIALVGPMLLMSIFSQWVLNWAGKSLALILW
jgi:proton-translocating NADH-quinone oxidoreductase chain N